MILKNNLSAEKLTNLLNEIEKLSDIFNNVDFMEKKLLSQVLYTRIATMLLRYRELKGTCK